MVSINAVWAEAAAFIQREARLLVPLAMATMLVASVILTLVSAFWPAGGLLPTIISMAAVLWSVTGQLAITALVLRPGLSVGEGLSLAGRRLWKIVAVGLILGVTTIALLVPFALGLVRSGYDPTRPETFAAIPAWAVFYLCLTAAAFVWLAARLCVLNALVVAHDPPVLVTLRTAFALTRGTAARLILVFVVYIAVLLVLTMAIRFGLGSLFLLIARGLESPLLGIVLMALANGAVAAGISLAATVFLATLYRQLTGGA